MKTETQTKQEKENFDFPIKLSPIKSENLTIPNKLAVIREDTQQPIGIVSDKYSLIKHVDAVDMFRKALENNKYEERIELMKNGAQLFGTYKLLDSDVEVSKGDLVAMQIILKNSYDSSKALQLILGAFRLVCSNGMVIGKEFFSYTQKHIAATPVFDEIKDNVSKMIFQFKDNVSLMQKMDKAKTTLSGEELFNPKKIEIPKYLTKIAAEKYDSDESNTVWSYYNCLTYSISHEMKKESPNARFYYLQKAWNAATSLV